MILYDTPGVIEKKMHKLDSMMMKNVRSATINADCVLVVVDACKPPENVMRKESLLYNYCIILLTFVLLQIDEVLKEGVGELKDSVPVLLVLNKRDLIKPGEIAKKLEVRNMFLNSVFAKNSINFVEVGYIQKYPSDRLF